MNISVSKFVGYVYPDRTFSVGFCPRKKKRVEEKRYDRNHECQYDSYLQRESKYGRTEYESVRFFSGLSEGDLTRVREESLLVNCPKSSPKTRGGYGKHGITNYGRKFVSNTALLLQRKYGKHRLGFGTCTIPSGDKDVLRAIGRHWGDIVRRFYQKIRRKFKADSHEFIYVGVTEIQEKRFASSGMPVPHLHFVYVSKNSSREGYFMDVPFAYKAWNKAVNEVLVLQGYEGIMGRNGHTGSVKLESIRVSAAGYLGKYISKGCKVVKAMREQGFEEFPKQWWQACMHAKKMFKESIVCMDAKMAQDLFYRLEDYLHEGLVVWGNFVEIELGGKLFKVGCHGTFSEFAYKAISTG